MFYDYYINSERVAHDLPWQMVDQNAILVADSELRFSEGIYNVRGTVSADGNTLNLDYTFRPGVKLSANSKEEVVQYTR